MFLSSRITGVGHYLPPKIITNHDLPDHLETSDEWIRRRTGILQRHIAENHETTAFMATAAAQEALCDAHVTPQDVDAIVVATTTPDHVFPATATKVQALLGASHAFAFDMQAVCAGFVYGLTVADSLIKNGQAKTLLLIGAERMTSLVDWHDRNTCVLFGDGAGAMVIQRHTGDQQTGIVDAYLKSDGDQYDILYVDKNAIMMEGRSVFKHAITKMCEAINILLTRNNLTPDDIQHFVPHQANQRIIQGICDHFHLPPHKMIITVDRHANTSAASIPLAYYMAKERLKPGDLIITTAIGGGLSYGAALIRV